MKVLTLSIKQKWFDAILAGKKKTEEREIRPHNFDRYAYYLYKGKMYDSKTVDDIPDGSDVSVFAKKPDALKLLTGEYKGKRPYMIVEVKEAVTEGVYDENGEPIYYEVDGKEYQMMGVIYALGKVIERV